MKLERDWKIFENQALLDREKETYKSKINDAEKKLKESETKKQALMFEFEKDKAKWMMEWDHLETQKQDLIEQRSRLEKMKEKLVRENEKLKNDNKSNKRMIYGASSAITS